MFICVQLDLGEAGVDVFFNDAKLLELVDDFVKLGVEGDARHVNGRVGTLSGLVLGLLVLGVGLDPNNTLGVSDQSRLMTKLVCIATTDLDLGFALLVLLGGSVDFVVVVDTFDSVDLLLLLNLGFVQLSKATMN